MPKMYKLTTQENTTHGGMEWVIGKTNTAKRVGKKMCSDQVLHCYYSPEQAAFFNPIHANIRNPRLYEIDCSEIVATDGCKFACKEQTPVKELTPVVLSTTQRVVIGIKLALLTCSEKSFNRWAEDWLAGGDRSAYAAYDAAHAAVYAAHAAVYTAAHAAARAAVYAAAYAAYDAAHADAAYTAAAYTATAHAAAADAAAHAAYDDDKHTHFTVELQTIIEEVMANPSFQ